MTDAELGRLRWRCRRGMKELDALLVAWLEQDWPGADSRERAAFEALLGCEDDELWRWLSGRSSPAEPELGALVRQILGKSARHPAT